MVFKSFFTCKVRVRKKLLRSEISLDSAKSRPMVRLIVIIVECPLKVFKVPRKICRRILINVYLKYL